MEYFKKHGRDAAFWVVAAFFGLLILDAFLKPPSKNRYNPHNTYDCESASCEGFFFIPNVESAEKTTETPDYLKDEKWRSERSDLAAQWETADRTRLAFRAAMLGVWLLVWTIVEAKTAANFAEQTLKSTKETSYKELRAYLGVVLTAVPIKDGDETLSIRVTIKNFGQTPAYNIKFAHIINFVPLEWGGHTPMLTTAILNSTETFSPRFKSKKTDISEISGVDTVYFHLSVKFFDMNNEERWMKMRFSKSGKEWPTEGDVIEGAETMYLVKMETGDLPPDDNYNT